MSPPRADSVSSGPPPGRFDAILAPIAFVLALLFLILLAGLIHRIGSESTVPTPLEKNVIFWCLLALWPIFLAEAVVRFWLRRRQRPLGSRFVNLLLIGLFPPCRLVGRAYADPEQLWLPGIGWQTVDRQLRRQLERLFSIPMIVVALLVLPVVGTEYFYADCVRDHFKLGLVLDIANSFIWSVFTIEFMIMLSVADKKLQYCLRNWIDLAIVILPILDFLPILRMLRLTRIVKVQHMTRMGRLYRMRGLLTKLWRAVLVLGMVQKLLNRSPEKQLQQLRELAAAREEELDELRREIHELEQQIRERDAARSADLSPG